MRGAIHLFLKTEGELQQAVHRWMWRGFGLALIMYMLATIFTLAVMPKATRSFENHPWSWIMVVLTVLAFANIPRAIFLGRPYYAFLSSSLTVVSLVLLFSFSLYPNLVVSSISPEYNITVFNAASSPKTLRIMGIIALIGIPFVLACTAAIYWAFRGKVKLSEHSCQRAAGLTFLYVKSAVSLAQASRIEYNKQFCYGAVPKWLRGRSAKPLCNGSSPFGASS